LIWPSRQCILLEADVLKFDIFVIVFCFNNAKNHRLILSVEMVSNSKRLSVRERYIYILREE